MNNATVTIERVRLAAGIGGYWVQDQPAIQTQAEPDGFFFRGEPVSPGFRQIREPSEAYCVLLTLADGEPVCGDCRNNVDKAIARRLAMFPQSAIQTRAHCEDLPEFVSWIRGRIERLAGPDYRPDLHFDFHAALGRLLDNDESRIADYFAAIVE